MGQAGGQPAPYVAIGTYGDFERVLGCQVNDLKTISQALGVFFRSMFSVGLDINLLREKKIATKNRLGKAGLLQWLPRKISLPCSTKLTL